MVQIDLLRAFVVLGEIGNYAAAAKNLGVAQPTLSKQIARLEDRLGQALFRRSRQGTALTEFGQRYLLEVRPLIRDASRIWDLGRRMAAGEAGSLAIGFTFSAVEVMTRALATYREAYPDIELTFEDISSQSQYALLREHRLDIAFARWPGGTDLQSRVVSCDRPAFVFPTKLAHEIDSIDSPLVRELPFIRLKRQIAPGFENAVQRLLEWKGIEPRLTHWVNESLVQLRMVAAGFGVAVMHESAVKGIFAAEHIRVQGLDGPGLAWQTGLYWRRDEKSPVVRNFLEIALEAISTIEP